MILVMLVILKKWSFIHRFLPDILKEISKGIDIRKEMGEKRKEEHEKKYEEKKKKIDSLKTECKEVNISLFYLCN